LNGAPPMLRWWLYVSRARVDGKKSDASFDAFAISSQMRQMAHLPLAASFIK
jgi:hypothetical protein